MSGSLNKVMLIGHLGDEVKIHYFDDKNLLNEQYSNFYHCDHYLKTMFKVFIKFITLMTRIVLVGSLSLLTKHTPINKLMKRLQILNGTILL